MKTYPESQTVEYMYFELEKVGDTEYATPYFVLASGKVVKAEYTPTGSCWMTQFIVQKPKQE